MATKNKSTKKAKTARRVAKKVSVVRKVTKKRTASSARTKTRAKVAPKKKVVKRVPKKPARVSTSRASKKSKASRAGVKRRVVKKPKRSLKKVVGAVARKQVKRRAKKSKDTVLLETLMGSIPRARMLRLFLREPAISFDLKEVAALIGVSLLRVKREVAELTDIGILSSSSRGGKRRAKAVTTFPFMEELRRVTMASFPIAREELIKAVKPSGKVKLIIVGGVFLNDDKGRVDLLVVADKYSEKRLARAVKKVEQSVATELRWAGMETKDFQYRWKMFDRFVRDITSRPHEKIIQKIKL